MTNEKDSSGFGKFQTENLGVDVQHRMVKDVKALMARGMTQDKAVDWVYARRKNYIENPNYSLAPYDGFPLSE